MAQAVRSIGAAVALMTALGAQPAAGSDASNVAVMPVSNQKIEPPSPSRAMAWAPQARLKSRRARHARGHPERVAAVSRQGCGWAASPCERQFVLILGVGF